MCFSTIEVITTSVSGCRIKHLPYFFAWPDKMRFFFIFTLVINNTLRRNYLNDVVGIEVMDWDGEEEKEEEEDETKLRGCRVGG